MRRAERGKEQNDEHSWVVGQMRAAVAGLTEGNDVQSLVAGGKSQETCDDRRRQEERAQDSESRPQDVRKE